MRATAINGRWEYHEYSTDHVKQLCYTVFLRITRHRHWGYEIELVVNGKSTSLGPTLETDPVLAKRKATKAFKKYMKSLEPVFFL